MKDINIFLKLVFSFKQVGDFTYFKGDMKLFIEKKQKEIVAASVLFYLITFLVITFATTIPIINKTPVGPYHNIILFIFWWYLTSFIYSVITSKKQYNNKDIIQGLLLYPLFLNARLFIFIVYKFNKGKYLNYDKDINTIRRLKLDKITKKLHYYERY